MKRKTSVGILIVAPVSVSGPNVSGDKNTKSVSWTNNKEWLSDLSGRATYGGFTTSVHVTSSTFALHNGSKKSVDVWSW